MVAGIANFRRRENVDFALRAETRVHAATASFRSCRGRVDRDRRDLDRRSNAVQRIVQPLLRYFQHAAFAFGLSSVRSTASSQRQRLDSIRNGRIELSTSRRQADVLWLCASTASSDVSCPCVVHPAGVRTGMGSMPVRSRRRVTPTAASNPRGDRPLQMPQQRTAVAALGAAMHARCCWSEVTRYRPTVSRYKCGISRPGWGRRVHGARDRSCARARWCSRSGAREGRSKRAPARLPSAR